MGNWYKLVFKQNQPIHIGAGKWGVIKETEIFITGQVMWGALVNAYILQNQLNSKDEIKKIEEIFEKITNFFPSFDKENILEPKYKDGEFYLGNISEKKFRFHFVDTIMQTAIEPISRQAKDESLHEFDFLLTKPKDKKELENFGEHLYWIGLINLEELSQKEIENFFKEEKLKIYIGGDVRYGFGELELVEVIEADGEVLTDWQIDCDGKNICFQNSEFSLYFIEADLIDEFEGELLLIPELDFSQNTPIVKDARFFASVGSKIIKFKDDEKEFDINQLKRGKIYNARSY